MTLSTWPVLRFIKRHLRVIYGGCAVVLATGAILDATHGAWVGTAVRGALALIAAHATWTLR